METHDGRIASHQNQHTQQNIYYRVIYVLTIYRTIRDQTQTNKFNKQERLAHKKSWILNIHPLKKYARDLVRSILQSDERAIIEKHPLHRSKHCLDGPRRHDHVCQHPTSHVVVVIDDFHGSSSRRFFVRRIASHRVLF